MMELATQSDARPRKPPNAHRDACAQSSRKADDFDIIMRSGGWYYKVWLGCRRGPLELITLKSAWATGIIDKHTFILGKDMDEWAPIHMVWKKKFCNIPWNSSYSLHQHSLLVHLHIFYGVQNTCKD